MHGIQWVGRLIDWCIHTNIHPHRAPLGSADGGREGEGPFFDLILSAETFYTADITDKVCDLFEKFVETVDLEQRMGLGVAF